MSTITLENIVKKYGDVTVIDNFNAHIENGEFVTLLGPSGCGKTTILRMIAGFLKQTSGVISIDEKIVCDDTTFIPPEQRGIGMVFQTYAVWPHMNVFDNVAYPLKIQKLKKSEIQERVRNVLEIVHLSQYEDRMPSQLSGGQQQRVALGRALVAAPNVLLLDEPLSNLDAKLRENMRIEIKEIQKKLGITVVYVTHDQIEAMTMSDRIFLLNNGVVQQIGTPSELYQNPASQFVANFIGKANFVKAKIDGKALVIKNTDQHIPYAGDLSGDVVLTVRPENLEIVPSLSDLSGTLSNIYYHGNESDCVIDLGGTFIRVTTHARIFDSLNIGQTVHLKIHDKLVYTDDGTDVSKILT